MARFANLSGEEGIGLGIAAAAHVALVAALVWQVGDKPTALPVPERIEVSLADDVSLTSTAPDPSPDSQAAVAPTIAPEPPAPEPEPIPTVAVKPDIKPVTQPVRQPAVKPSPAPAPSAKPSAKPSPKPSTSPPKATGGSRLGNDFLAGVGGSERSNARGTPAVTFGPAEAASLNQAIGRQIKPHWVAPQGPDAELLVTIVRIRLNPDGSLAGPPQVVRQSGDNETNRTQKARHAEQAIRAIRLAAPFDLPSQFYDKWKVVDSQFDKRL